ncbi:MAG: hypothetical protein MUO53_11485 [Maribacter sp.]|nr:hypothetical protein [Maribacter sp.]
MKRRSFVLTGGLAGIFSNSLLAFTSKKIPPHNWDGYNFGPPPPITDRLFQGPFSNYGPEANAPGAEVIMATTPSLKPVSNFGMGLVTYVCDEVGPPRVPGETLRESIEKLAKWPLGDILYLRADWRDIQKEPGRLDFPEYWNITFEMAKKYNKRVAFRIQMMSPVIEGHSLPGFLVDKVPFVKLGTTKEIGIPNKVHYAPRYDHPEFMKAFKEMDSLLAEKYNGHELVEYVDTFMYGFWGEGHTWPFEGNPLGDYLLAENTFLDIFEHQATHWNKTPLATNTQPDYNNVGNSEVLDRTVRSYNWLRTDTIFIENSQIDALSNRPAWIGATIEQGLTLGDEKSLKIIDGISRNKNIISHVKDVGANYFSLWNWHKISLGNLVGYYEKFPEALNELAATIGYRVRPSWIWYFEKEGHPGIVLGLVNDGISGVPGALRITIANMEGTFENSGSLDPGYPLPGKVRQALFMIPKNVSWETLTIKAEIEVKGIRHPIKWACAQELESNGSLGLKQNI